MTAPDASSDKTVPVPSPSLLQDLMSRSAMEIRVALDRFASEYGYRYVTKHGDPRRNAPNFVLRCDHYGRKTKRSGWRSECLHELQFQAVPRRVEQAEATASVNHQPPRIGSGPWTLLEDALRHNHGPRRSALCQPVPDVEQREERKKLIRAEKERRKRMRLAALGAEAVQACSSSSTLPLRRQIDLYGDGVTAEESGPQNETSRLKRSRSPIREESTLSASRIRPAPERPAEGGHQTSPDEVHVFNALHPARCTSDKTPRPHHVRSPSPALFSHVERTDRILAAQQVLAKKKQYRRRISSLSEKYGVRPTELFRLVTEMPKQMYWLDVEKGLRKHYGY